MKLGCSLCGWKDLSVYKVGSAFENFAQNVMLSTNLRWYEFPFLPNITHDQAFLKNAFGRVYSIHASKHIFEKSMSIVKNYFFLLYEFCAKLDCNYVVVHPPATCDSQKLEAAISCMKEVVISIENVSPRSFELFSKYNQCCKMTIDIAHLLYLDQVDCFECLLPDNISHFHLRGFSPNDQYVTLESNKSSLVLKIINDNISKFECPWLLEYPYESIFQLKRDINMLKLKENIA